MPLENRFSSSSRFQLVTNDGGGGGTGASKPTTTPTKPTKPVINEDTSNKNEENTNTIVNTTPTLTKPTYDDSYLKQYLEQNQAARDSQTNALNELRDQLRENSYLDLMKSNIALANAKDAALRYTDNYMRAAGYGSQGMSATNQTQNRNAYLNALQGNRATNAETNSQIDQAYQESLMGIESDYNNSYLNYLTTASEREYNTYLAELQNYYNQLQQQQEWDREDQQTSDLEDTVAGEDWFNTLYSMLDNYNTKDDALAYLNGLDNWEDGLTANQIRQINAKLNSLDGGSGEVSHGSSITDGSLVSIYDSAGNTIDPSTINNTQTASNIINVVRNQVSADINTGEIQAGDVIKITSGGYTVYMYYDGKTFYNLTPSNYNKVSSSKKHSYRA